MKKHFLSLLLFCTPFTSLMAAYDAETGDTGYEVRLKKTFGQTYDNDIKVWITLPDGTVAKRITDFEHDGNTSDDRFFVPDYRVEDGFDHAPYQSLKLRIHMQDPGKRGNALFGIILDAMKLSKTPRHRSSLVDIKLDREKEPGLPFIHHAAVETKNQPMVNFVSYNECYLRDSNEVPFTGAEHQRFINDSAYINDDILRVHLHPSWTVMGD